MITLQQLSCYLPYGLKIQYEGIINGKEISQYDKEFRKNNPSNDDWLTYKPVSEIKGLKIAEVKELKLYKGYWKIYAGVYRGGLKSFYNGSGFKPLLRPLSDLTEKDWHQVFSAGMDNAHPELPTEFLKAIRHIEMHDDCAELIFDEKENEGCQITYTFNERMFENSPIRFNQLAAFNEIYKLHADVEFLIDAGLAINQNNLPKQ